MRFFQLIVLFVSLILVSTHDKDKHRRGDKKLEGHVSKLSDAYMKFAVILYKLASSKIARATPNIFFSPLSIPTSLTMLALGAKLSTRQQILRSLSLNVTQGNTELNTEYEKLLATLWKQDEAVQLYFRNWIFVQKYLNVTAKYQQDITDYYNGSIESINFNDPQKAEMKINDFVRNQMGGKVGDLVSNLNSQTKLVLIDIMSYSAKLLSPFIPHDTQDGDFAVTSQRTVRVPMLHRVGHYKTFHDKDLDCTVVEVPCAGNVIMLLIMQNMGDLEKLENVFTRELINKYLHETKTSLVDFYMPKLSFEGQINLQVSLLSMGITQVFSDNADLSGISQESRLKVSQMFHKTLLNISEAGTEASSGTVIQSYVYPRVHELKVDRPFLAVFYSKAADTILLMGRVMDPSIK